MIFADLRGVRNAVEQAKVELEAAEFMVVPATPPKEFAVQIPFVGALSFESGQIAVVTRLPDSWGLRLDREPVKGPLFELLRARTVAIKEVSSANGKLWRIQTWEALQAVTVALCKGDRPFETILTVDQIAIRRLFIGDWSAAPVVRVEPSTKTRPRTGRVRSQREREAAAD